MKNNIIIIPTRLGASRLKGKPLMHIKGIPMIIHILKSAIKSGVGKVYVTSPDKEILEVEFNVNNTKQIKEISNLINKEGKTEVKVKIKDQDSEFVFKLKNRRQVDRKSINKLKNQDILSTIL